MFQLRRVNNVLNKRHSLHGTLSTHLHSVATNDSAPGPASLFSTTCLFSNVTQRQDQRLSLPSQCKGTLSRRHLSIKADLTHYDVLGLEKDASPKEIRAAFLKRSKECHPDTNVQDPTTHKQFVLVNEAYSVLSKPHARRDYDISIAQPHRTMNSASYNSQYGMSSEEASDADIFYHQPRYREQFWETRDKSKDEQYKHKPYYGIKGLEKVSNMKIVIGCFVFMMMGIVFHTVAVRKSSTLHIKHLDERDAKTHKIWMNSKKNAELYSSEEFSKLLTDARDERAAAKKASKS